MARSIDPMSLIAPVLYKYRFAAHAGALLPDAAADRDTAEAMEMATVDTEIAKEKARTGDVDGAIQLARAVVDYSFDAGDALSLGEATRVLVESLLARGTSADLKEAQAAIDRLAAEPTDPGFVLFEVPLLRLRALLARAHGDAEAYKQLRDRYRDMAKTLGFEGHVAWAEAMP